MSHPDKRPQALRRFALALAARGEELCAELSADLQLAHGELLHEQLPLARAALEAWAAPGAGDPAVRVGERRAAGAVALQLDPLALLPDLCRVMPAAFLAGVPQILVNTDPAARRTTAQLAALVERCLPGVILSALPAEAFLRRVAADPYTQAVWIGGAAGGVVGLEERLRATGAPITWEQAGNHALVVGRSADLGAAARAAASAFRLGGHDRARVGRVYVHADRHEALVAAICAEAAARAVEDPTDPAAMVSPLRADADRLALLEMLDEAEDTGASLDVGLDFRRFREGSEPVLYPTVVSGCDPALSVVRLSKPGPVLAVVPWTDENALLEGVGVGAAALYSFGVEAPLLARLGAAFGHTFVNQGPDGPAVEAMRQAWGGGPEHCTWRGAETLRGPIELQRLFTRPRPAAVAAAPAPGLALGA
ncbi:MAG: aldehyde dehydrogenase family protein [Deltaproteobacteria bacterium]|nr:aldehyde dehydrogenase family protein [Deltaproteobacteria bacterium]